ncbi:14094_t:CDS:1, partial [Racocetra fulgida]
FEKQQISVKHLGRLSDEEFKQCGVDIIGARRTLHDYAEIFQNTSNFQAS